MCKPLGFAIAGIALFLAQTAWADNLNNNPYYQQMQQRFNQASNTAAKTFDQKFPQPKITNDSNTNQGGGMPPPVVNNTSPIQQVAPALPTVTPPPVQPKTESTLPAKEKNEKKDGFNIFLPPSGNANGNG